MPQLIREPILTIVTNNLPSPPYPAGAKANGWKPELDIQRIKSSRTWVMCPADLRPWLLMLWMESWESVPVGTFPVGDDEVIAARIGMDVETFKDSKIVLMRGWYACEDGNYYHPYISILVKEMLETREFTRNRKRIYDEKRRFEAGIADSEQNRMNVGLLQQPDFALNSPDSDPSQGGSNALQGGSNKRSNNRMNVGLSKSSEIAPNNLDSEPLIGGSNALLPASNALQGGSNGVEQEQEVLNTILSKSVPDFGPPTDLFGVRPPKFPPCPHREIVDLYHEVLPEQPSITFSLWLGSKDAKALADRWKEDPRHRSLDFWRAFFLAVRTNSHWMGGNGNGWRAGLRWLVQKSHFTAGVERMVEERRRRNG